MNVVHVEEEEEVHFDFVYAKLVVGTIHKKKHPITIEYGARWVEMEQNENSMIEGYSIGTMIVFSQFN